MIRASRIAIALLVLISSWLLADDVWTPEISMRERNVGSAAVSPDGKLVAYTVTEAVIEEKKSEYLTHIWISASDGSRSYQLTRGEKSCSSPRWSPDGKWIAFTSTRGGKKSNIWLIPPDGGEARRLTDVDPGVGSFRWSPDGEWIAFLMSDPETEEEKKAKEEKTDVRVLDTQIKYAHLYKIKADLSNPQELEVFRLTEGNFHITGFDWSPDSRSIAFSHRDSPKIDDWPTSDISVVQATGGEVKPLVSDEGMDSSPLYSPDGKWIAFVSDRGESHWAGYRRICVTSADGSGVMTLPETFNASPGLVDWAPNSKGVLYSEAFRTDRTLFYLALDGGRYERMIRMPGVYSSFDLSKDGSFIAFCREDVNKPEEVYILTLEKEISMPPPIPVKISNANGHLPELPFCRTEVIKWAGKDGREIEGILHYPLNYEEGKKYPLLLNIHGGPAGVYSRTFTAGAGIYPLEAFAAQGYAVLRPNPRGSTGYGKEFRFANVKDLGGGDYEDVMAGVDHLIRKGIADPERLGVMGWSYGGYMTSVIITKNIRFRAAVAGAAPTDTISYIGETDIRGFYPSYLQAELWENYSIYQDKSPVYHVANATTPTLFIHGENDIRVPTSQALELHYLLKRKGVDTEMVLLPRTAHGPREPKLVLDVAKRHFDWFEKYLLEEIQP